MNLVNKSFRVYHNCHKYNQIPSGNRRKSFIYSALTYNRRNKGFPSGNTINLVKIVYFFCTWVMENSFEKISGI